jgi:hypothetical protein
MSVRARSRSIRYGDYASLSPFGSRQILLNAKTPASARLVAQAHSISLHRLIGSQRARASRPARSEWWNVEWRTFGAIARRLRGEKRLPDEHRALDRAAT